MAKKEQKVEEVVEPKVETKEETKDDEGSTDELIDMDDLKDKEV